MKIVFFGTPDFAAELLKFLAQKNLEVVAIVTREDKPKGRGLTLEETPVKKVAKELFPNVPLFQPKKASDPDFITAIKAFNPDYFIVVAYGQILKQSLLDVPSKGCINVHTSLLPKLRGAAPIQRAIMNGELKTGVTIMHMSLEMDAGDILKQVETPISINMTFGELRDVLCDLSKEALFNVLQNPIEPKTQDHALATFAPKVELEDCQINWEQDALSIHNLIRGSNPEPGAWCYVKIKDEVKKLKIFSSFFNEQSGEPGQILSYGKKSLLVAAKNGSVQLLDLQLEGRKRLSAAAFCCGIELSNLSFTLS